MTKEAFINRKVRGYKKASNVAKKYLHLAVNSQMDENHPDCDEDITPDLFLLAMADLSIGALGIQIKDEYAGANNAKAITSTVDYLIKTIGEAFDMEFHTEHQVIKREHLEDELDAILKSIFKPH